MSRTPSDNSGLLLGLGLIVLLGLCPPLGVIVVFILVFAAK